MDQTAYCAFISYRHQSPDQEIAKRLHTLIERYAVPAGMREQAGGRRLGKVFRDQEELPLSPNLGKDIETALDNSQWLICVCSPRYLESRWCLREVEYFISRHGRDRVLALLAEGEPADSFPDLIRFEAGPGGKRVETEPLAADVRGNTVKESLRRLNKEKLRILAPMLSVSFDGLYQRQKRRNLRRGLALSGGLIAALGGFLAYALVQNGRIDAQRTAAARNECDLLVEKSIYYTSENRRMEARQLALDAHAVSQTIDGYGDERIRDALAVSCYTGDFAVEAELDLPGVVDFTGFHSFSPDGRYVAAAVSTAEVACCDAMTGERLWVTAPFSHAVSSLAWSPDGSRIAICTTWGHTVCLLDAKTGQRLQLREDIPGGSWPTCTVFWQDRLLVCGVDGLRSYDPEDLSSYTLLCDARQRQSDIARVFDGGRYIGWLSDGATPEIHLYDAETGAHLIHATESWMNRYALSPDGTGLYVREWGSHYVLRLSDGEKLWEQEAAHTDDSLMNEPLWTGDLIWSSGAVYDAQTGEKRYDLNGNCLGVTRDGQYFLCENGVYRRSDGSLYAQVPGTLLTADGTGDHMLVKTEIISKEASPGAGSQFTIDDYQGALTEIPDFTEPGEGMIRELSDFYGSSQTGIYAPRAYCSPNGRYYIITNTGSYVPIYDLAVSGEPLHRLYEFNGYSQSLAPTPNLPGSTNLVYCPQVAGVAFSPDSRLAAFAGVNGLVAVYELETGRQLFSWNDLHGGAALMGIKFNREGTLIMAAAYRGLAYRVYSAVNGLTLYAMHAEKEVRDWGFDEETGDAVVVYQDGSALAADIFTTPEELYRYAEALQSRN